jgi:Protein of unknown function (DUF3078)
MRSLPILFLLTAGSISCARAQISMQQIRDQYDRSINKDQVDTTRMVWKTGGLYNFNFTQAALSNWAAGGDNSAISLSTLLSVYAFYKQGKCSWDNTLDMAYGLVSTTSLGTRKSDDRIDLLSKYGYDIGKKIYFSGLFNFRSQFTRGYSYPSEDTRVLTSNFAAPAYVIFSLGLDYKPNNRWSIFLSPVTARWVIVNNDSLSQAATYGVDSGKHQRFEFGAFASLNFNTPISKTASYRTRMDLFSDYIRGAGNVSMYWTNILAVKVTRLISVNISVEMIYDNDIKSVKKDGTAGGPALQLSEVMGIGLAYKFDNRRRAAFRKLSRSLFPVIIPGL